MSRSQSQNPGVAAGRQQQPMMVDISRQQTVPGMDVSHVTDYAHMSPADLLAAYWQFAGNKFSPVAAALVRLMGANNAGLVVTGDLAALVSLAGGLAKAHGRLIDPATFLADLGVAVPPGFVGKFLLYLQAAGIRPDDIEDRETTTRIKQTIRRRINAHRAAAPPT